MEFCQNIASQIYTDYNTNMTRRFFVSQLSTTRKENFYVRRLFFVFYSPTRWIEQKFRAENKISWNTFSVFFELWASIVGRKRWICGRIWVRVEKASMEHKLAMKGKASRQKAKDWWFNFGVISGSENSKNRQKILGKIAESALNVI